MSHRYTRSIIGVKVSKCTRLNGNHMPLYNHTRVEVFVDCVFVSIGIDSVVGEILVVGPSHIDNRLGTEIE